MNDNRSLLQMHESDIQDACLLIKKAMNGDEARWAEKTMRFHFGCRHQNLDDGRHYYIHYRENRLVGLVGLHHYEWGPEENVWLAWFAVHPDHQRNGIGKKMLELVEKRAMQKGYTRLFVETYDHPDFSKALQFYAACGFERAGSISNYLTNLSDMIVYRKNIK